MRANVAQVWEEMRRAELKSIVIKRTEVSTIDKLYTNGKTNLAVSLQTALGKSKDPQSFILTCYL
jgi:hypothetical protein